MSYSGVFTFHSFTHMLGDRAEHREVHIKWSNIKYLKILRGKKHIYKMIKVEKLRKGMIKIAREH